MKLTPKIYTTRNEKILDFVIGFVGWYVLNGVLYAALIFIVQAMPGDSQDSVVGLMLVGLPLLINIVALTLLAFTRRWIALGALAAFGLLLVGALILGLFIYAVCFSMGNSFR